ncbi:MAG: hypothetical protein EXQ75_06035 [Candidatus Planktophila sp.]|nr:hypothetical protein [Candidatus Planktophila sp.]
MCIGCMGLWAAAFAVTSAQEPTALPAAVVIVQKPTAAQLVRAAFKENTITKKANPNNRAI